MGQEKKTLLKTRGDTIRGDRVRETERERRQPVLEKRESEGIVDAQEAVDCWYHVPEATDVTADGPELSSQAAQRSVARRVWG